VGYVSELRALVGQRPLILACAGALILDEQGRLLLQHRTDNGCWGIPGGGMELGESLEGTARREVREETGLEIGAMTLFGIFTGPEYFYTYPNGDQAYFVSAVYLTSDISGDLEVNRSEGLELRFFAVQELPSELNPADRPIIEQFVHARPVAAEVEVGRRRE
jgi:8-oxo-dGTP pyrophosphatase MutT (NUDIX family)